MTAFFKLIDAYSHKGSVFLFRLFDEKGEKVVIKRTNLTAVRIHSRKTGSHWKKTDICNSPWAKGHMRNEKRCFTCASKQLHKIFNTYCEICFNENAFNPFYSYAKSVIVCSRHLFSGGEREKKSSCIYDKLIYTDSKQSKKRHWEIFKLFQSSILNGQISLKLKCFAWVAITLCRCSRQGYKRITSGMIWIFLIHLTP